MRERRDKLRRNSTDQDRQGSYAAETIAEQWRADDWYNEHRPRRLPNTGLDMLLTQLRENKLTKISLKERQDGTDLILRYSFSSLQLLDATRSAYLSLGVSIDQALQEIIWKPSNKSKGATSYWAQLAKAGSQAYSDAWIHLFEILYLDHFGADIDAYLKKSRDQLSAVTDRSRGRRREIAAERENLRVRFMQLLHFCNSVHALVIECNRNRWPAAEIRSKIWETIRGHRGDHNILGHTLFRYMLGHRKKGAVVHDGSTWKPKELALALLASERGYKYATVERKLGVPRTKTS